jgi:hypothetical protein
MPNESMRGGEKVVAVLKNEKIEISVAVTGALEESPLGDEPPPPVT